MTETTVTMPQLGESVVEGTIGQWLKAVGERVAKYEPLVEVITDKVNTEIPSPVSGVLQAILVKEGATVPVGTPIAVLAADAAEAAAEPQGADKAAGSAPQAAPAGASAPAGWGAPPPAAGA
ncbi:MAG: lipoyl domain-containing protein, partial [Limnochordales bacterium]